MEMGLYDRMRIAIVDDQEEDRERIARPVRDFIRSQGFGDKTIEVFISADDLLCSLEEGQQFNLFLLDAQMPKMDGIMLAERIRSFCYDPIIIYISDHIEYAPEAFKVSAHRFFSKKAFAIEAAVILRQVSEMLSQREKQQYIIEKQGTMDILPLREIYYLEAEGKYVRFIHDKGDSKERASLQAVLKKLDNDAFIEVDRKRAVNLTHVIYLEKKFLKLRNGETLHIAKGRDAKIRERILKRALGEEV